MDNDQVLAVNEEQAANGEAAAAEAPKKATRTRRKAAPKAAETDPAPLLPELQQPAVAEPVPGEPSESGPEVPAAEAKAPVRRTRSRKKVAEEPLPAFAGDAVTDYRHRPGLSAMVRQHVQYGRGMSQVLMRYGLPEGSGWSHPRGAALLRPNGQPGGSRSAAGLLRRASLGVGRAVGIVSETVRKRRASSSTGR